MIIPEEARRIAGGESTVQNLHLYKKNIIFAAIFVIIR
jgi:hypothetical protein